MAASLCASQGTFPRAIDNNGTLPLARPVHAAMRIVDLDTSLESLFLAASLEVESYVSCTAWVLEYRDVGHRERLEMQV